MAEKKSSKIGLDKLMNGKSVLDIPVVMEADWDDSWLDGIFDELDALLDRKDSGSCQHPQVPIPKFDEEKASKMSSDEVRKTYPCKYEHCNDCGSTVTMYASFTHYIAGDW